MSTQPTGNFELKVPTKIDCIHNCSVLPCFQHNTQTGKRSFQTGRAVVAMFITFCFKAILGGKFYQLPAEKENTA